MAIEFNCISHKLSSLADYLGREKNPDIKRYKMWIKVLKNSKEEEENRTATLVSLNNGTENDGKFIWHIGGQN